MKYTLSSSQINAQKAIEDCDRCLVIKAPRSGKTLTFLDYFVKNKIKKVLWIVPDTNIRDIKLPEEIAKWGMKSKLKVTPILYGSLKKYKNTKWDAIVGDEIHKLTEPALEHLKNIQSDKFIICTGTFPNKKSKVELINQLNCTLVYTFDVTNAVENKSISDFLITIKTFNLNSVTNIIVEYTDKFDKQRKTFYTSELKKYTYTTNKIAKNKIHGNHKANHMLYLGLARELSSLSSKIEYCKKFIKDNPDKRYLIFAPTRKISEEISSYCYNGETTDEYYNKFNKKEVNHLVLVNKGGTGETYNEVDGCILIDVNSSNTIIQQKIMRTVVFRENYIADIQILISKNTIQEEWIMRSLYDIDKNKIIFHNES
jgi:hypothetical protein